MNAIIFGGGFTPGYNPGSLPQLGVLVNGEADIIEGNLIVRHGEHRVCIQPRNARDYNGYTNVVFPYAGVYYTDVTVLDIPEDVFRSVYPNTFEFSRNDALKLPPSIYKRMVGQSAYKLIPIPA